MKKYNIVVRRRPIDNWSAWCTTNKVTVAKNTIRVVKGYGYDYFFITEMPLTKFKILCFKEGLRPSLINGHVSGEGVLL